SSKGDYLRGRLVSMDDRTLKMEVRLEAREIPRDRVTRIIWLHPDPADAPKPDNAAAKPAPAPKPDDKTRVQAVQKGGVRLPFFPQKVEGKNLNGRSEVLGSCRVALPDVEYLLIGDAIEQEASRLAYQQWTLHNAIEPKAVTGGDGGGEGASDG